MITTDLKELFKSGEQDNLLMDIYLDENKLTYQKERYVAAIEQFEKLYGVKEVSIYSAPGRSEIGGNHTDHQNGEVLAASVNLDAIAIVEAVDEPVVKVVSGNYPMITVDLKRRRYNALFNQRSTGRNQRAWWKNWWIFCICYK